MLHLLEFPLSEMWPTSRVTLGRASHLTTFLSWGSGVKLVNADMASKEVNEQASIQFFTFPALSTKNQQLLFQENLNEIEEQEIQKMLENHFT